MTVTDCHLSAEVQVSDTLIRDSFILRNQI